MSSEQRAALVEQVEEAIRVASRVDGATFRDITEAALTAVEAAGWGPRPEAVTVDDQWEIAKHVFDSLESEPIDPDQIVDAIHAVLTSDVLRSRGITVEGEQ